MWEQRVPDVNYWLRSYCYIIEFVEILSLRLLCCHPLYRVFSDTFAPVPSNNGFACVWLCHSATFSEKMLSIRFSRNNNQRLFAKLCEMNAIYLDLILRHWWWDSIYCHTLAYHSSRMSWLYWNFGKRLWTISTEFIAHIVHLVSSHILFSLCDVFCFKFIAKAKKEICFI